MFKNLKLLSNEDFKNANTGWFQLSETIKINYAAGVFFHPNNIWKTFNCSTYTAGSFIHLLNGKVHNEDGPAYISQEINPENKECTNIVAFYVNGIEHREGAPSRFIFNGKLEDSYNQIIDKENWGSCTSLKFAFFRQLGIMHREDGPAYIESLYKKKGFCYFINGVPYEEADYKIEVKKNKIRKIF